MKNAGLEAQQLCGPHQILALRGSSAQSELVRKLRGIGADAIKARDLAKGQESFVDRMSRRRCFELSHFPEPLSRYCRAGHSESHRVRSALSPLAPSTFRDPSR